MDPAILSYLTAQQMVSQQIAYPLLQSMPITVQDQQTQQQYFQPVAEAQLMGMDQYFKPTIVPATTQPLSLPYMQLLNNNTALASLATPPPPQIANHQELDKSSSFLALFQQLVQAQQTSSIPLFVDHASTLATLGSQPQQQRLATPIEIATTVSLPPTVTLQSTITLPAATTVSLTAPANLQPKAASMMLSSSICDPPTVSLASVGGPTVSLASVGGPTASLASISCGAPATVILPRPIYMPLPTVSTRPPPVTIPALLPTPTSTVSTDISQRVPIVRIDSTECSPLDMNLLPAEIAVQVKQRLAVTVAAVPPPPTAALPEHKQPPTHRSAFSPVKNSPVYSEVSTEGSTIASSLGNQQDIAPSLCNRAGGELASTSKSNSVDEEMEMMGDEFGSRPEDLFVGRQRRAEHIAFHRKMKALLKSIRDADLVCKLCAKRVDRHDNAFKAHIAEHATGGTLECRYCGFDTPSRIEMNQHMGERHPNGSERAYTDKRDHLKMIEIMHDCFAKVPKFPKKDPALVKPRGPRKKRSVDGSEPSSASASASEASASSAPAWHSTDTFENILVRFCTDGGVDHGEDDAEVDASDTAPLATEATCGCGDEVPRNPSALLSHVKTLHARYRCTDCNDVLETSTDVRKHTVRMHGGDEETYAERIVDHLMVDSIRERFLECFITKRSTMDKTFCVQVLQNNAADEREKLQKTGDEAESDMNEEEKEMRKETEIKEEPVDC